MVYTVTLRQYIVYYQRVCNIHFFGVFVLTYYSNTHFLKTNRLESVALLYIYGRKVLVPNWVTQQQRLACRGNTQPRSQQEHIKSAKPTSKPVRPIKCPFFTCQRLPITSQEDPLRRSTMRLTLGRQDHLECRQISSRDEMNNKDRKSQGKKVVDVLFEGWKLDSSISRDPLVYILGMVLSQQKTCPACNP